EGSTSASQTVAMFTDPGGAEAGATFSASIGWGDGSTSSGTITGTTTFTVTGAHDYAEEGSHTITVTIGHEGAPIATATSSATVADAPLHATGKSLSPVEGASFSGIVATITDDDPAGTAADYSASITWGDGHSSTGSMSANGSGGFDVSGTNTYAEEGSYAISVAIADVGGSTATASSTATVADAALTASGVTINPTEGDAFSGVVAHLTDADPNGTATDYGATIFWGDGPNSSAGTVVSDGHGGFTVSGSYTYTEEGGFPISVIIHDAGGSMATASSTAIVADAALTASGVSITTTEGAAFSAVVAHLTDADFNGTAADYSATITWGDGHSSSVTVVANGSGGFDVSGTNTYAEEGSYAITVSIN